MKKSTASLLAGTALIALTSFSAHADVMGDKLIVLAQANPQQAQQPNDRRQQVRERRQEKRNAQQNQPQNKQQGQQNSAPQTQQQQNTQQKTGQQQNTQQQADKDRRQQVRERRQEKRNAQQNQNTTSQTQPPQNNQQKTGQQQGTQPLTNKERRKQARERRQEIQNSQQNPNSAPNNRQQIQQPNSAAQGQPKDRTGQNKPATGNNQVGQQHVRPHDTSEFIRRNNGAPARKIDDLHKERQHVREGDRTIIKEGNRTIIKEGNRTVIRHDEGLRFALGARGVNVHRVGGETRTVVERPDGSRIVTVTDANGRLLRRTRQFNGREVVIIDNPGYQTFVMLPPPVIRIPRERYIVDYRIGMPALLVYETLLAPPVEPIAERYTIEQIRYSEPVRARMPRVDLDINFETGSWQLTPDQIAKLEVIADGIKRAIEKNPQEVFLIEGHTDAVGNEEDNLSLSDRRAEAVAVALTEQYQVPPENLATQGYGEQNLKIETQGPSEENRRVAVRRVTPLLAQGDGTTGGGQPQ